MQGDIRAGDMLYGVEGVDIARRDMLIDLLDIDLDWRLNKVSDGQRRRVQIAMGLLKPYQVPIVVGRIVAQLGHDVCTAQIRCCCWMKSRWTWTLWGASTCWPFSSVSVRSGAPQSCTQPTSLTAWSHGLRTLPMSAMASWSRVRGGVAEFVKKRTTVVFFCRWDGG